MMSYWMDNDLRNGDQLSLDKDSLDKTLNLLYFFFKTIIEAVKITISKQKASFFRMLQLKNSLTSKIKLFARIILQWRVVKVQSHFSSASNDPCANVYVCVFYFCLLDVCKNVYICLFFLQDIL